MINRERMEELGLASSCQTNDSDGYELFLLAVRDRFAEATKDNPHLFRTDASGLFEEFLWALPERSKQHYTCRACRRFVEHFGGLVSISENGKQTPVMWDCTWVPPFFAPSVSALERVVARARVVGVHMIDTTVWGQPQTGAWHHMHVIPEPKLLRAADPNGLTTLPQVAAEKTQDFETLHRGLAEYSMDTVLQAKTLLSTESLYRGEKCLGVAEWLLALHKRHLDAQGVRAKANVIWLAVASAPPGWCHVKSTMIGTLLDDIAAGLPFEVVSRRFAEKMNPLQYQRPTAAPTDGQIAAAEKMIETLGTAGALKRRFAKLEDLQLIWKPTQAKEAPASGGVFSHLRHDRPGPATLDSPAVTMTWEKFARTVLPTAERIECFIPNTCSSYLAFVTAEKPDAPQILQWDNPVSWYVYVAGSHPQQWQLQPGQYNEVTGIALQPSMWGKTPLPHQGESVTLILRGARDTMYKGGGGLFPEMLKSEYHAIRHVIEAYSKTAKVSGGEDATACGLRLNKGWPWACEIRVTSGGTRVAYRLDRWD